MVSKVSYNDKAFKIGDFTYNSRKNFYHMKMIDNKFYEIAKRLELYYDIIDEYEDYKYSEEYTKNKREEYIKKIRKVFIRLKNLERFLRKFHFDKLKNIKLIVKENNNMIFDFDYGSFIENYKWIKQIINDRESPEFIYTLFREKYDLKDKEYVKYKLFKKIWKLSSKFEKRIKFEEEDEEEDEDDYEFMDDYYKYIEREIRYI